jgi:nicotinamide-nucleotide amidase
MKIELISTGNELLTGKVNSNAGFIGETLFSLGLELYAVTDISDRKKDLISELNRSLQRSDVIILTGGLGPTFDDITVETVAECLGIDIYSDTDVLNDISEFFKKRNIVNITSNNSRQANIIKGAKVLRNLLGTAPGQMLECSYNSEIKTLFLLPGPPRELQPLFNTYAIPYFKSKIKGFRINRALKICDLGESFVESLIKPIIDEVLESDLKDKVEFGILAHNSIITVKFSVIGDDEHFVKKTADNISLKIENVLKDNIFGYDLDSLEIVVGKLLKERKQTIAIAESCTGGMIAQKITSIAGSSVYFKNAFVTYSNEAKMKFLGVKKETLRQFGAVSSQTAYEMAEGLLRCSDTNYALSITGIAGPDGGTKEKPIGLVYIGLAVKNANKTKTFKYVFMGRREDIRERATNTALNILRKAILKLI